MQHLQDQGRAGRAHQHHLAMTAQYHPPQGPAANQRLLRWALARLAEVASLPAAVLLLNQSRNVHRPLAAFADIVIAMEIPRPYTPLSPYGRGVGGEGSPHSRGVGAEATRRRTFTGVGRYPGTLQTATAELNPEGTDYLLLPDSSPPHPPLLTTLQTLLAESPTPLTRN